MRRIGLLVGMTILGAGLLLTVGFAQGPHGQRPQDDPLAEYVFPPELVMQHQREIGLTDEQKAFLRGEIQRVSLRFTELQWQIQDSMEGLVSTLKTESVNEQQALTQLDKILDTEREIKHLHVSLAVRIKNRLTPEQQAKLQALKQARK